MKSLQAQNRSFFQKGRYTRQKLQLNKKEFSYVQFYWTLL
jgi:hypothetical protein